MNEKKYIVTENLEFFLKWKFNKLSKFREWLANLLITCLSNDTNLVKISHDDIIRFFKKKLPDDAFIISLDKGVYSKFLQNSIFQFDITRFYDITKWEIAIINSECTHHKRDWWEIESQIPELIKAINKSQKKRLWLLDDWKFSWWTIKTTIKLLKKNYINLETCLLWVNVWADKLIEWIPIISFYNIDKDIYIYAWRMPENDFTNFWWASIEWNNIPYIKSVKMIESRLKVKRNPQLFHKKIKELLEKILD